MENLTFKELQIVINSLTDSIRAIENYDRYPSEKFRKIRIEETKVVLNKIKNFKLLG